MCHHLPTTIKPIIGKKLINIERLFPNSVRVTIEGDKLETFETIVEGDCCSQSIFYKIVFPPSAEGQEIIGIEENVPGDTIDDAKEICYTDHPDFLSRDGYCDSLSVWDVVIKTKGGNAIFKHINHSNGYYDGYTIYSSLEEK